MRLRQENGEEVSFLSRDWTGRVSVSRQEREEEVLLRRHASSQDLFYTQIFSKMEASSLLVLIMTSNINKNSHYSQILTDDSEK